MRPIFASPEFPEVGKPMRFFHLGFIAIDGDDPAVFAALLRAVYNESARERFSHFIVGLHERDPLLPGLEPYAKIPFEARLFCVHFEDGDDAFAALDSRPPYIEPSLL